jgi:hypothetical protein
MIFLTWRMTMTFKIYWNENYMGQGDYKNALQCKKAFAKLLGVNICWLSVEEIV